MISLTIHFGVTVDAFDPHTVWLMMLALALMPDGDQRAEKRRKKGIRKAIKPPRGPWPG